MKHKRVLSPRPFIIVALTLAVAACQAIPPVGPENKDRNQLISPRSNPSLETNQAKPGNAIIRGNVKVATGELRAASETYYKLLSEVAATGGTVTAHSERDTQTTQIQADGSFAIEVTSGNTYTLEAVVPDGRGGVTKVIAPEPVRVPVSRDPVLIDAVSLVTRRTGSIQGLIVLDSESSLDTPEGTDVYLAGGTSIVGKAGETGRFALINVPVGTWNIVCAKPGYKRQVIKGVVVQAGKPAMLDAPITLERLTSNTKASVGGLVVSRVVKT